MKDKPQDRKRGLFPKVSMSRICTECLQIAKKNMKNPLPQTQKMNKKCTKENVQMPNKHKKIYSASPEVRYMQI